jgi:hypothetical protein
MVAEVALVNGIHSHDDADARFCINRDVRAGPVSFQFFFSAETAWCFEIMGLPVVFQLRRRYALSTTITGPKVEMSVRER